MKSIKPGRSNRRESPILTDQSALNYIPIIRIHLLLTMVTLSVAQASNASIATTLPSGMVAVFVGGTSGIGGHALKSFAEHARSPLIYLVGRSQEAADVIIADCTKLNPDGRYIFIQSDVSLLNNVVQVCERILSETKTINLLFQSQGGLQIDSELCPTSAKPQCFCFRFFRWVTNSLLY